MKKVIITGAAGFIGYHLVCEMISHNIEVYAVCREHSENVTRISELKSVHIIECNLQDIERLPCICSERDFDAFYHLAWEGASGRLRKDYCTQINNVVYTTKALDAAIKMNCRKFISTGTVCENQCDAIINQDEFITSSYYLNAKRFSYEMVKCICTEKKMPFIWCTFYHPVGKYNKKEQLIMNTAIKLITSGDLNFGPAQNYFDVVSVEDLCHGLFLVGEHDMKKRRYFIGSGSPRRLIDYLEEMKEILASNKFLNLNVYDDKIPVNKEWLDISDIRNETGYEPKKKFKDIILELKDYIEHYYIN